MRKRNEQLYRDILDSIKRNIHPEVGWARIRDVMMEIGKKRQISASYFYTVLTNLEMWGYIEKSKSSVAKISIVRLTTEGKQYLSSLSTNAPEDPSQTAPQPGGDAPIPTPQTTPSSGADSPSSNTSPEEGEKPAEQSMQSSSPPSANEGDEAGKNVNEVV